MHPFAAGVFRTTCMHLDRVDGATHFEVDAHRQCNIWQQMHAQLPGYLLPRLVREEARKYGKTWINPVF